MSDQQQLENRDGTYQSLLNQQKKFFLSGATKDIKNRAKALKRLEKSIRKHEDEIFRALQKDLGRTPGTTFKIELGPLYHELKYLKSKVKHVLKKQWAYTPAFMLPTRSRVKREPYGQVLLISPWNYPVLLTFSPLAAAISCGNTVVIKPSEISAATSAIIQKVVDEALVSDWVSVVQGPAEESKKLLEQRWDYIFFTGSTQVGRTIAQQAAKFLTPTTLELGGKSPAIVTPSADLAVAARRIIFGKFTNSGQTCVAPDYLYVHQDIKKDLIEQFKIELLKAFGEHPVESVDLNAIISHRHWVRLVKMIENGKPLIGGGVDEGKLFIEPTLMDVDNWNHPSMAEEIFGPILPVLTYNNYSKLLDEMRLREKPLSSYIFSSSKKEQDEFLDKIATGSTGINDCLIHVANHYLPFGGVGDSGSGSYHGKYSFETFTHQKAIIDNPTWIDLPFRYAPSTRLKDVLARLFMAIPW